MSRPVLLRQALRNRARRRRACRRRSGRGGRSSIGLPLSSSSPVRTISMSASFRVPAACIARSAATITTIPPLSSPAPGPSARVRPCGSKRWNGRIGLEHRVEMADQEHPLAPAAALVGGDDMAGAAGLGHRDPSHLEAERLELGAHHPADRLDSGEVQRAAVLVHQPLEQTEVSRLARNRRFGRSSARLARASPLPGSARRARARRNRRIGAPFSSPSPDGEGDQP